MHDLDAAPTLDKYRTHSFLTTTNYSKYADKPRASTSETTVVRSSKKDEEEEKENSDWRSILNRLNQSVKQVEDIPKIPDPLPQKEEQKSSQRDFIDIKLGKFKRMFWILNIFIKTTCKRQNRDF